MNLMGTPASIYDIPLTYLDGTAGSVGDYRGKVLLVVNVASRCGFTPQYAGLEELYRTYRDRGFVVLGMPCNQFLWQEPGTGEELEKIVRQVLATPKPIAEKTREVLESLKTQR